METLPPTDRIEPGDKSESSGKLFAKLALTAIIWLWLYIFLNRISNWISFSLLGLDPESKLGGAVSFFIFEAPKVLLLLLAVVFVVGIIRSFFTPEKTRRLLAGRREFVGNIMASLLGIVTPFCSCSAVPLFIGFVETGVPLGVTLSFLIASPMINEVAMVLLLGMFGIKITAIYVGAGLLIAFLSGLIIGKLRLEKYIEDWVHTVQVANSGDDTSGLTWAERINSGKVAVREIVGKVWPYVLGGIAVGAIIHGYVPQNMMASIMTKDSWWSVPLAVILGVPMYSNAAGIMPIMLALLEKGVPLGTALAFMMAVIGLSLPETIILRKVLKIQLIAVFVSVVAFGIMAVGFIFNLLI